MWKARVFTLYPELFPGPFGIGLYKKALEKKLWALEVSSSIIVWWANASDNEFALTMARHTQYSF